MRYTKSLSIVIALCFLVSPAFALDSIGTITFIEGVADIARNGAEPVLASEQATVNLGDRIRTKSYSKAEITLADKSIIKLAPSSCVSLDQFKLSDNNKREFARIKLTRGKLEAIVSKTGAPETFVIDTPNAQGAVKGSDIFVSYMAGKTGVFVKEGAIAVLNPAVPGIATHVPKGNCVFVPLNEAPSALRAVLDLEMNKNKKDVERSLVKKLIPAAGSGTTQMNAAVVSLSGEVRVYKKDASDWSPVKVNDIISEGDKLQTGEDAKAEVRLGNGNILLVQSGTELAFTTLRYDSSSGNYQNVFDLAKGKVSGVVDKLGPQSTFQLKTTTAVCGVRGTFVEVVAPTAVTPTQAFYEGGSGFVTSIVTGQTMDVAAGQNISVDPSGLISSPLVTSMDQRTVMMQTWAQSVSPVAAGVLSLDPGTNQMVTVPPPPPEQMQQNTAPGNNLPLGNQINNMAIASTLSFDQVLAPTTTSVVTNIYTNALDNDALSSSAQISGATMDLILKSDNTWSATASGTISATTPTPWDLAFLDSATGDMLVFNHISEPIDSSVPGPWNASPAEISSFSGSVYGAEGADKSLTLTEASGTSSGLTFSGSASGTWHDF